MVRWLPLWSFVTAYLVLNVIGSLVLLWRIEPFFSVYEQHAGVSVPVLSSAQEAMFVAILLGGPLALAFGYGFVITVTRPSRAAVRLEFDLDRHGIAAAAFSLSYGVALWSLYRGGAFQFMEAWTNYEAWIDARWRLFATLTFFEYTNIYIWLPLAAALLALSGRTRAWRWLPLPLVLLVDLMVFQKKPAVLTILTVLGAVWLRQLLLKPEATSRYVAVGAATGLFAVAVYAGLLLLPHLVAAPHEAEADVRTELAAKLGFDAAPSLSRKDPAGIDAASSTDDTRSDERSEVSGESNGRDLLDYDWWRRIDRDSPGLVRPGERRYQGSSAEQQNSLQKAVPREVSAAEYTFVSLTMRTAGPAWFYAWSFPYRHPFFELDLGRPFRKGPIPTDPAVVWHAMYPNIPGSAAAPFNFGIYAQGGLAVCLLMSALVGAVLALCWHLLVANAGGLHIRCLLGISLIAFSIHLTLDSLRHSVIVSYGYFWALALVMALAIVARVWDRSSHGDPARRSEASPSGP